jgi:Holliday junction resolvase-like predicted endonuclease
MALAWLELAGVPIAHERWRTRAVEEVDVAVATHKTIDLVVQTQVKKLQRNMQG